ncbi:MAG: bifunctional methylenetetrahydrofolate dehydrogenase/methenyltetrahydrofolate cyclohydrolase FolD [Clostridiales bacterium]|nr:bifunctional methylenetetrahydrofolate dehydrogenase/methenyltetrahydrofolate cyclohydrolase FolD [Clostridiales bacterium]
MANIISGKELSAKLKDELKIKVKEFEETYGRKITLAVILVGENPASQVYVKNKIKSTEYVGMRSLAYYLPENSTEKDVEETVLALAKDVNVDGILVQLPLPKHLDEGKILNLIPAEKDVDGFLAENVGKLVIGEETTVACTPFGVMQMLKSTNIPLSGKNAVVIGRSNIVGKPMALLLLQANCTVTVCHSKTVNLKEICANADVLVAAIGRPEFVTADMVKEGAIVIDVGINRTEKGLVGDVKFYEVEKKASYITPVPGGVGPMTIAMLLENTYLCALRREKNA